MSLATPFDTYFHPVITGGSGNDALGGTEAPDELDGAAGNDQLAGEAGNDTLRGGSGNDRLLGGAGNDTLDGGAGDDVLNGGSGADTMSGGPGNDNYTADSDGDSIFESLLGGSDSILTDLLTFILGDQDNVENLSYTGTASFTGTGNELANIITGGSGDDTLAGGAGADKLLGNGGKDRLDGGSGTDELIGGPGDDTYVVDLTPAGALQDSITEAANSGVDTVQLRGISTNTAAVAVTLPVNLEVLDISNTGLSRLNLTGNSTANVLVGNAFDNLLDGGAGADTLAGGDGNDTYVLDHLDDQVSELGSGIDLILVKIAAAGSTLLGDNIECATLANSLAYTLTGNSLDNVLTGNAAANTLVGGDGNDRLDGRGGNDILMGGLGDDIYFVDSLGDQSDETGGGGNDTVVSSISISLAETLENLTLLGLATINGTGNSQDNVLTGNAGNNVLDGQAGNDWMRGGAGNDTYLVDSSGDLVMEDLFGSSGGKDQVKSSVSYQLGANLDDLVLLGTATAATGNELSNTLTGNSAANRLDGWGGRDSLIGGLGDDTYVVNLAGALATAVALEDAIVEAAGAGTDSLEIHVTAPALPSSGFKVVLGPTLERLYLYDSTSPLPDESIWLLNGQGNGANNLMVGNGASNTLEGLDGVDRLEGWAGNDLLDGGKGPDTLIGGSGNDTYVVDDGGDQTIENASEGSDTVRVSIAAAGGSYTLMANVENATLINSVPSNLTGNELGNTLIGNSAQNRLIGNSGDDLLDGATGADILTGGTGNDTYIVDTLGDQLDESGADGNDSVKASISYTLAAPLENLDLIGTAAINGRGNASANRITGNGNANLLSGEAGDDRIDGGLGSDTLVGGTGDDSYWVDNSGDSVIELAGEGHDCMFSSVSRSLASGFVDDLVLVELPGGNAIDGTGNGLANQLTGNASANSLDGGDGDDMLSGLAGNDILIGSSGNDVLNGGQGDDNLLGGTGNDLYQASIGDTVNELGGAGSDTLSLSLAQEQLGGLTELLRQSFDDFRQDLSFSRMNAGRDLKIDFTLDNGDSRGSVIVAGMSIAATMVESLRLYDSNGSQIGGDIDLASVWQATATMAKSLTLTGGSSSYGMLAA